MNKHKHSYIIINSILLTLLCLAFYSLWIKYNQPENIIINPPLKTVGLLEPISKIPSNEAFDPPYEYTYNAGLIKNPIRDGYILSFTKDLDSGTPNFHTEIQLMILDKYFKVIQHKEVKQQKFYTFYKHHWNSLSTAQDPRIFVAKQQIYLVYNDCVSSPNREVYIAKLSLQDDDIDITDLQKISYPAEEYLNQKNWSPFVHNDEIYFIYSTSPYVILHWNPDTNVVTKIAENSNSLKNEWPYGIIRGGTPAVFVKELNAYLTFFHSSLPYRQNNPPITKVHQPSSRIYYMGAYLFDSKPPFNLIAFTPVPLSYPGQYTPVDTDYHIIFPCGLIEEKDSFLISAGVQDTKAELFKINKTELYQQLKYFNRS